MNKQFTVAIIGAGARGAKVYGRLMRKMPEQYRITHLCDIKQSALDFAGDEFEIPCESRFIDPKAFFAERRADILVAAIGKPKFVGPDMVKEGACVIDVGINRLPDGKICGDVDYDAVLDKVSAITPVPGGVGPMTITMLLKNTLLAAKAEL